jgi:hypothetical protein
MAYLHCPLWFTLLFEVEIVNTATIGRRTYEVPGRFNELQPRQLIAVVGLLHSGRPLLEVMLRVMLVLLDVKRRPWLSYQLMFKVSDEKRHQLLQLAAFAFKEPKLYEQRLPVLSVGPWYRRRRLYGPASSFANLSFAEFIDSEAHFAAYATSRDESDLDRLVANLYRPGAGKARQLYTADSAKERVPLVTTLPLAAKLAVRVWYASCRQAWAKKYEGTLFAQPEGGATGKAPADPRAVWNEVLAERAGSPDRYELYGQQLLPNVLFDLDLRIRRRMEEQEAIKNRKP